MNTKELQKLVTFLKSFPEFGKITKELLTEFLYLQELNKKLIDNNELLTEELEQYKRIVEEVRNSKLVIH